MPSNNGPSTIDPVRLIWAEQTLGRRFKRPNLLIEALTHPSAPGPSYERLEFLGDRVLGLVITDWLYQHHPNDDEGKLARRLGELVRRESCAEVARRIGVADHVRVERGAGLAGVQHGETVLGDVCEALIGALYLDGGMAAARVFIRRQWADAIEAGAAVAPKDAKSALQEWAQGRGKPLPRYNIVAQSGPDHAPSFTVEVHVDGEPTVAAQGSSKQDAQKKAAVAMLTAVRARHG